jgi:(p)ppGpp synthase/HD superfamily hydrolase
MIPNEFDDYISVPKPNGYRSIHTAVIASSGSREGQRVEVQIRSKEMHEVAERGLAAHWRYKARGQSDRSDDADDPFSVSELLRDLLHMLTSGDSRSDALDQAKIDLYQDQVFPFTPRGRVIPLPRGATALDFAYALHTEIGDKFAGARINGVQRPTRTPLKNGDVVEILKSDNAAIPTGWETMVITGAAKTGIRRRIRTLRKKEQRALGERIVTSAFAARDLHWSRKALDEAADKLGFGGRDALYEAVGRMDISGQRVVEAVFPNLDADPHETTGRALRFGALLPKRTISLDGVTAGGAVRLGTCCAPLPGERIVGVRDTTGGIVAHRIDCDTLADRQDDEWLNLSWTGDIHAHFVAPIVVTVNNRTGALGHIGTMLARYGADIVDLNLSHREVDFSDLNFDIAVRDARHLTSVLTGLRASDYVVAADRRDEMGGSR